MRTISAGWVLLFAAAGQDKSELADASNKKTQELACYKFNVEFEVKGFPGSGNPSPKIEGTFSRDEGLHVRVGDSIEVVKKGKKIAHIDQARNWQILEDRPPSEGGDREKERRDWQTRMIKNIKAPHEELKGIDAKFKDVKKSAEKERADDQDCDLYSGELTAEGAKDLMPNRGMLNRAENLELKGSGRVWVNAQGAVVKYQVEIEASGTFRGNEFTVTVVRSTTLSQHNEAKSEIPEEAKKLLDAPPEK